MVIGKNTFKIYNIKTLGEHNGYNLSPSYYVNRIKEEYDKKELIYILNQIQNKLINWSLKK